MIDLKIFHLIVHEIEKEHKKTETFFTPSSGEVIIDELSENLIFELHNAISNSTKKVYGIFYKIGSSFFKNVLDQYLLDNEKTDLLENSKEMIGSTHPESLVSLIQKEPLATGGHIVIAHYELNNTEYFVIAMLNNKKGKAISFDEKGIPKIFPTEQIDFELMDIACRINLKTYQDEYITENYLCFFSTREAFSKYFINFIGCQQFNQPKDNTKKLLQLLDNAAEKVEDPESFRTTAYNYCSQCQKNKDPIVLDKLSEHLYGVEGKGNLREIAVLNQIKLDNSFYTHKGELAKLISFKYKGDWIESLRFNRKNIEEKNITYNDSENSVILKNVPNLCKKIKDESR